MLHVMLHEQQQREANFINAVTQPLQFKQKLLKVTTQKKNSKTMSITKTIGGDRIGSGQKMKAHLHNYNRSTHDLSEKFATSANCGILYPCLVKPAMRGDQFDIKINADARTIPTVGPLFGNFLFQVHFYQCPVRLYQSILHNNPQAIGLKMKDVKLPKLEIYSSDQNAYVHGRNPRDYQNYKFSNSSLLKYLGMSGLGSPLDIDEEVHARSVERQINAIPALAYYDIFKTYYANKQEDNAYVISTNQIGSTQFDLTEATLFYNNQTIDVRGRAGNITPNYATVLKLRVDGRLTKESDIMYVRVNLSSDGSTWTAKTMKDWNTWAQRVEETNFFQYIKYDTSEDAYYILLNNFGMQYVGENFSKVYVNETFQTPSQGSRLEIVPFPLKNIDDMRYDILSHHELGASFKIRNGNDPIAHNYLPYSTLVGTVIEGTDAEGTDTVTKNKYPLNGLVLKTYQSDIFNNWLNAEWIEGDNGVNELSKVQIVDGKFSMDALSFAQKQYDMLNRIAVAGNTYEDWQDVVYEPVKRRQIESPMFIGGMSQRIYFDEIVQTSPAEGDPLGTLGGRGAMSQQSKKGGTVHVKCDEACFIIGIASLTPIIYQTQGNEFYMTELDSLDDLHKPAMDGIGFQDLVGERLAWWDTKFNNSELRHRSKIGKLPAWIEYMTSVDKAYGDFAETEGRGYMILNRNYEVDEETGGIKDVTTYIDPTKYNYVFANTNLDAQNFWLEIDFDIKARRLMSARIMPNV